MNLCFGMRLNVPRLLLRIDMPDDIIRQSVHLVSSALGHLRETLGFSLVFERVAGEVDAYTTQNTG